MFEYIKHFDINKIFAVILAFSIGASLALVLNGYIEYKYFSLPPAVVKPVKVKEVKTRDYSKIASIFRTFDQEIIVEEKEEKKEKKNEIVSSGSSIGNITLVGTLVLNKEKYALIKVGDKPQIVKKGSNVGRFKVEEIGKFFVILSKGGRKYKLTVKLSTTGTTYSSREKRKPQKTVKSENSEVYRLDKRFVEQQTADIGKLLKDVFIVPVVRNGETVGFKFRYVKPGSLLYKYGFRSGDLILSVNGKPIRTVEEAFKIYNILRNEKIVKVEIERRGKVRTIIYEIQ